MPIKRCTFPGCERVHCAKSLCSGHWLQRHNGKRLTPLRSRVPSRVYSKGQSWYVELYSASGSVVGRACISKRDVARVRKHRWRLAVKKRYAGATINGRLVFLHRFIYGLTDPKIETDHKNGDGLDCRRSNMRIVTHAQNGQNVKLRVDNTTGHRNVYFSKRRKHYFVTVHRRGTDFYGGAHPTLTVAVKAAKALRAKLFTHHVESRYAY